MEENGDFRLSISKIKIKNFRGIKCAEAELDKLNVLIGKNNAGKSTIFSALDILGHLSNMKSLKISDFNVEMIADIWRNRNNQIYLKENLDKWSMELVVQYIWQNLPYELWDLITEISNKGAVAGKIKVSLSEDKISELSKLNSATELQQCFIITYYIGTQSESETEWSPITNNFFESNSLRNILFPKLFVPGHNSPSKQIIMIEAARFMSNGRDTNVKATASQFSSEMKKAVEDVDFVREFNISMQAVSEKLEATTNSLAQSLRRFAFDLETGDSKRKLIVSPTADEWLNNPGIRIGTRFNDLEFDIPLSSEGYGYQNIFNIIARVESSFKDIVNVPYQSGEQKSILFVIEEPEAYTHPQLQHIFITNLAEYIEKKAQTLNIDTQVVVISHSAEVALSAIENNYNVIHVNKLNDGIKIQNWNRLDVETEKQLKEFKKILLNFNAESLFADKLILYEGDAERILLNGVIRKLSRTDPNFLLNSDRYALIPIGKNYHKFDKILPKLGYKGILVFTDIDFSQSSSDHFKKVFNFLEAKSSSNYVIRKYFLKDKKTIQDRFREANAFCLLNEQVAIYTQNKLENSTFYPSTLEPAFLFNEDNFAILKSSNAINYNKSEPTNELEKYISSKTEFALDILENIDNIAIPTYITEGLKWLDNQ